MEAARGVPYCRLMLGAVQLLYEVYSSCGEEDCNVMYTIEGVHKTFKRRTASNLYAPYPSLVTSMDGSWLPRSYAAQLWLVYLVTLLYTLFITKI